MRLLLRPVLRWAVRRGLVGRSRSQEDARRGRFTAEDARRALARTWAIYGELAPGVPREAKLGPWMNVHLAAVTLAFNRALREQGVAPEYAISLTADCAWKVYERWGRIAHRLARFRSDDPAERMRISVDAFLRFPFTPPCYRFLRHRPEPGVVAFDMRRCPVADYMASTDASELCVGAWCNQDFALAEQWGGELRRTKTIAAGDGSCDFRFVAAPRSAPRAPSAE